MRPGSARSERRGWPHPHPRRHRSRPTRILSPAWKTQASCFLVLQGLSCGTRHTPQGCAQNDARSAPPPPAVPACLFRPSLRLPLRALRPGRFSLNALVENALWRPHPLATTPRGLETPRATVAAGLCGQCLHVRAPEGVTGTLGPTGGTCWHWPPARSAPWPGEESVCRGPCRAGLHSSWARRAGSALCDQQPEFKAF